VRLCKQRGRFTSSLYVKMRTERSISMAPTYMGLIGLKLAWLRKAGGAHELSRVSLCKIV
jgi:hypothetical protein